MKYLILSMFIFSSLVFRIDRLFLKQNGSFAQKFILPDWSKCPQFETSCPNNLSSILDQPYTYLTKGREFFVFLSQDEKWVLKFFRLPRYFMRYSLKGTGASIPSFRKVLENSKRSYEELSMETSIFFAHLKPTFQLSPVAITDRMGICHRCDLNDTPFIIQRYGAPFFEVFGQHESPKELILKTVALYENLFKKGFIDLDPILDKNFGVIDNDPFIIDIGQLEKVENLPPKDIYLQRMTKSLALKLEQDSPELFAYYKNLLR